MSCSHGSPYTVDKRGRKPFPVWFFHNDGDEEPVLVRAKILPDAMAKWGVDIRVTIAEKQKGHAARQWCLFQPELIPWIFSKKLETKPSYFEKLDLHPE